jgi:hypothetical protein
VDPLDAVRLPKESYLRFANDRSKNRVLRHLRICAVIPRRQRVNVILYSGGAEVPRNCRIISPTVETITSGQGSTLLDCARKMAALAVEASWQQPACSTACSAEFGLLATIVGPRVGIAIPVLASHPFQHSKRACPSQVTCRKIQLQSCRSWCCDKSRCRSYSHPDRERS